MHGRTAWSTLGLAATADVGAVRRAYADKLRGLDVDADPAGFARLREAREVALRLARSMADGVSDVEPEPSDELEEPESETERTLPALALTGIAPPSLDRPRPPGGIDSAPQDDPAPWRSQLPVPDGGKQRSVPLDLDRLSLVAPLLDRGPVVGAVSEALATDDIDAAYRTILAVLHPDTPAPATTLADDESVALDVAVGRVLRDPRLDELAFHADAERWFGDVLGDAIPRSDPVLYRVAERLGWLTVRDRIGLAPATERILDRIDMLVFVTAVERPGHRLHRAWRELTKPAMETSRRNLTISRKRMNELLTLIRTRHPDAEEYLDAYRVGKWERKSSTGGGSWWLWIFVAVTVVRLLANLGSGTGSSPSTDPVDRNVPQLAAGQSAPLRELTGDLDLALLSVADGFTAAAVREQNPNLYDRLADRWRAAKAAGTPTATFLTDTRRTLYDMLAYALPRADYDDIAAWRRQELIELTAVESRGAEACDLYLKGDFNPAPFLSEASRLNRQAIVSRILLADTGPETQVKPRDRTFRITGSVIEATRERTKLDGEALAAAFRGEGTADARCRVRKALLEIALDLPRAKGLELLRQM